eukprot:evm.model.scf_318.10 EVM.evm.TU.scf_318.10   scf_318:63918-65291(-)
MAASSGGTKRGAPPAEPCARPADHPGPSGLHDVRAPAFSRPRLVDPEDASQLVRVAAWAAAIEPRRAAALMKELAARAKLPDALQHLKRIRRGPSPESSPPVKLDVLLWPVGPEPAGAGSNESVFRSDVSVLEPNASLLRSDESGFNSVGGDRDPLDDMPEGVAAVARAFGLEPFATVVAGSAPRDRSQWAEWNKLWPIGWRPPEPHPGAGAGELDADEAARARRFMGMALREAEAAGCGNAAVIVDPAWEKEDGVVAIGLEGCDRDPLRHAVMAAVEGAAERERAVWGEAGEEKAPKRRRMGVTEHSESNFGDRTQFEGTGQDSISGDCRGWDSSSGASQGGGGKMAGGGGCGDREGEGFGDGGAGGAGGRPYLCSGFECYVVREPCLMCAMALVHSRVARVVYCQADAGGGALGGRHRLHGERSLNHHYAVYHMPLENDSE